MSVEVNDFKEQVRNHANIVEIVSGYVALKKKGRKHYTAEFTCGDIEVRVKI